MGKNLRKSSTRKLIFSCWFALGSRRISKILSMFNFPDWLSFFSWTAWERDGVQSSLSQAVRLKKLSQNGTLNPQITLEILREPKANQQEKISFRVDEIRKFFPKSYSPARIQETILKLLADFQKRQKGREAR